MLEALEAMAQSFVMGFKVAYDFYTSIWQKKKLPTTYGNRSFLVFFFLIIFWKSDQITQPSIDLNTL